MCRPTKKRKFICKYGHCEMLVPKYLVFDERCPVCMTNGMNVKLIEVEHILEINKKSDDE